ncbi:MAG: hypothetical protein KDA42_11800 [Planctomycetales bacterium]|nr:hypothetical protein [Planctomycetales bacterium]
MIDHQGNGSKKIVAESDFETLQQLERNPQILLWRLTDSDLTFAEIVAREDCGIQLERDPNTARVTTSWELFSRRLEKGVILRSRYWGLLVPRSGDEATILKWRDTLLERPLPLTA